MRVRFTTRKWPPAIGGMETYSVKMTEELATRCDLECIVLPGRPDGSPPSRISLILFGIRSALAIPIRQKVDVAHMADMALWPLGFSELILGRAERVLLSAHGSDVSLINRAGWRSRLYLVYLMLGARLLSRAKVIANSAYVADLAKSVGFRNVAVVPLGTDIGPVGASVRNDLLFVGRVSRAKGLRFLVLEVLPLLPRSIRLRVAGPIWDEAERPLLEHPQVDYLGILDRRALATEYTRSIVTLVPSQVDEGFGLVAIEAAACGSQVVASNGGGLREAVREPWGELVDKGQPTRWAEAIRRRVSLPPQELERVSLAAMGDVDSNYRWGTTAEKTAAHYAP